ncbi:hypothetical protein BC831DRAFT_455189 [Entophlyctis helioformis]|nr:hypothetical protein BC831DRAFT_455189 [Entophlyctis helioformis]
MSVNASLVASVGQPDVKQAAKRRDRRYGHGARKPPSRLEPIHHLPASSEAAAAAPTHALGHMSSVAYGGYVPVQQPPMILMPFFGLPSLPMMAAVGHPAAPQPGTLIQPVFASQPPWPTPPLATAPLPPHQTRAHHGTSHDQHADEHGDVADDSDGGDDGVSQCSSDRPSTPDAETAYMSHLLTEMIDHETIPDLLVEIAVDEYYPWTKSRAFKVHWMAYHLMENAVQDLMRAVLRDVISDEATLYMQQTGTEAEPYVVRRELMQVMDEEIRECVRQAVDEVAAENVAAARADRLLGSLIDEIIIDERVADDAYYEDMADDVAEWLLQDEIETAVQAQIVASGKEMGLTLSARQTKPTSVTADTVMSMLLHDILLDQLLTRMVADPASDPQQPPL